MLNPDLAARKAICYQSTWRALPDSPDRPHLYVQLSGAEVAELVQTGGFTLPESAVPESVRAWRKTQESALDIIGSTENPELTIEALKAAAGV